MKRTSILSASIIILLILFPLIVNARDMGFTYKHQFQPMSEKQIRTQIALLDLENFGSGVLAVGGLVAAGTGTISFIIGLEMFFSEPIIEWEPSHDFNPFFIIPFMQYAVGAILLIGGPILALEGFELTHIFSDNIRNNVRIRKNFVMVLKRFQPTSYKDRPGVGIGISLPLN